MNNKLACTNIVSQYAYYARKYRPSYCLKHVFSKNSPSDISLGVLMEGSRGTFWRRISPTPTMRVTIEANIFKLAFVKARALRQDKPLPVLYEIWQTQSMAT